MYDEVCTRIVGTGIDVGSISGGWFFIVRLTAFVCHFAVALMFLMEGVLRPTKNGGKGGRNAAKAQRVRSIALGIGEVRFGRSVGRRAMPPRVTDYGFAL